jgi:UDP-N-acetylglucosamine 1-carboxyvinyltransferase
MTDHPSSKGHLTAHLSGAKVPVGRVRVSGAKNSATRLLAAALVADEQVELTNFPTELVDVGHKIRFMRDLGAQVDVDKQESRVVIRSIGVQAAGAVDFDVPIRTTYLLAAAQLKRSGRARIPYPGGCKIGSRGYDLHVLVWESLGATVTETDDFIEIAAPQGGLRAGEITFPLTTVGGTENALITASIIEGRSTIRNAYITPEVKDLIRFLRHLGVSVHAVGNSFVEVEGSASLGGTSHRVIPDRIEALTWIVYALVARGAVTVEQVPFDMMQIPLRHIEEMGIDLYRSSDSLFVSPDCIVNGSIQPFELACGTHPGVISDMQPFYTLLGLHADGTSRIYDYRYPERLAYCGELARFYPGALEWSTGKITTRGERIPQAARATSTDLRGSMALVLAALLAEGASTVEHVEMALRGYNDLPAKLAGLGIDMEIEEQKADLGEVPVL